METESKEFLATEDVEALDYLEMSDILFRVRNGVPTSIPMMGKRSKKNKDVIAPMTLTDCKQGEIGKYILYNRSSD